MLCSGAVEAEEILVSSQRRLFKAFCWRIQLQECLEATCPYCPEQRKLRMTWPSHTAVLVKVEHFRSSSSHVLPLTPYMERGLIWTI